MAPKATAAFVRDENKLQYCSQSLQKCLNPIPSPYNVREVFADEICLENAINSYHDIESKAMELLLQMDLGKKEWYLAMRIVCQKPLNYFKVIFY